jgi:predicted O-methyltransferase YrrM
MGALWHQVRAYMDHRWHAGNRHDVHSPFVYALVEQALRHRPADPGNADIEALRQRLLRDGSRIPVLDLGAGSHRHNNPERRVRDIARSALKPRRQAAQLQRIARYCKASNVLELGTSLGLTTLYLARAVPQGRVVTIEGSPSIHHLAKQHFTSLGQHNIEALNGSFEERLPDVLAGMDRLDLAFLDGHHTCEATLRYFDLCLDKAGNDSVFILDDIHWSPGMGQAWETVKQHPRVTVTVDLFHYGLVFFRREQQREHFRLRY